MNELKKQIERMENESNWFINAVEDALTEERIEKMETEVAEHNEFKAMMKSESQPTETKIPVISFKWDTNERTVKFKVGMTEDEKRFIKALI